MEKRTIVVQNYKGVDVGPMEVKCVGHFGYHKSLDGHGYTVLHTPTRLSAQSYKRMRDARKAVERLAHLHAPYTDVRQYPTSELQEVRRILNEVQREGIA
jgi:hypothetical protein